MARTVLLILFILTGCVGKVRLDERGDIVVRVHHYTHTDTSCDLGTVVRKKSVVFSCDWPASEK